MNEFQKDKLAQFIEDRTMYEAVKAILEAQFDLNTLVVNMTTNVANENLGEISRSMLGGQALLAQGFKEIDKFQRIKVEDTPAGNPAK